MQVAPKPARHSPCSAPLRATDWDRYYERPARGRSDAKDHTTLSPAHDAAFRLSATGGRRTGRGR